MFHVEHCHFDCRYPRVYRDKMQFDVVVVGGGHAGTEAAAAAARRGAKTALISFDPTLIGAMSCNPAIGGVGKGHIVREVDAFDGLIARAADSAAIHYRMLNRSKGVAVHGPRVQADRRRYAAAIQAMLAVLPSLSIVGGEVDDLIVAGRRISGVRLADGSSVTARAVVLATGTFLGGRIFRGEEREEGGRVSERAATRLGERLRALGLPISRLKTGTPPRLDGRTIDWGTLAKQPSDDEDWRMSPLSGGPRLPQLSCAITRTNARTHDIIRASLDRSPLFSGAIGANGPRYCPSIEDKIHRFGDREGHQIFLEPEGLDEHLVYPNGISTSLPTDVQEAMVRSIHGLADVAIAVPGYAVEYDYVDPRSLDMRLHLSAMEGLFCAGQINGTTGYEEAAGQGLVAGLNAAAYACDLDSVVLDRSTSYLGVMVDDLVLQGVTEPYRMLTARAEHRLRLRADNAEARLGVIAQQAGCLGESRIARYRRRADERAALEALFSAELTAAAVASRGGVVAQDGSRRSARTWLRGDGIVPELLVDPSLLKRRDSSLLNEFVEDARYAPYLERLDAELAAPRFDSEVALNAVDYRNIPGLSNEMVERLQIVQPETLEAASRVRGVSPAALSAILLHVKRRAAA